MISPETLRNPESPPRDVQIPQVRTPGSLKYLVPGLGPKDYIHRSILK